MRALLLLLAVALAFLTVRWFRPEPEAEAGEPGTPHFLAPPAQAPGPATSAESSAAPRSAAPTPAPAPATSQPASPAWPTNLAPVAAGPEGEVQVAAAVAHGTPSDVQVAAATLPKDRALLLEAFAWAVAGERDMALDLAKKIGGKEALQGREKALLEAALTGRAATPASASSGPVARAMEMRLLAREAKQDLAARKFPEAAGAFSALLVGEIEAAWPADRRALAEWTDGLDAAQREYRWNPRANWPAAELRVEPGDSLIALRLRYLAEHPEAKLCTGLIERANRIKGHIQPNQLLKVPTDSPRILVDLEARWALFFLGEEVAAAWPVGIGRPGEETPPGDYTVRNKLENPPWMKEGQEPIPFGDPRNPLGTRWMGWSQDGARTSYGFHGTWDPESIGQAASDGCIRFANEDVEELFQILPEGAPIRIQG